MFLIFLKKSENEKLKLLSGVLLRIINRWFFINISRCRLLSVIMSLRICFEISPALVKVSRFKVDLSGLRRRRTSSQSRIKAKTCWERLAYRKGFVMFEATSSEATRTCRPLNVATTLIAFENRKTKTWEIVWRVWSFLWQNKKIFEIFFT